MMFIVWRHKEDLEGNAARTLHLTILTRQSAKRDSLKTLHERLRKPRVMIIAARKAISILKHFKKRPT